MNTKTASIFLSLCCICLLAKSCQTTPQDSEIAVSSVVVTPPSLELTIGEKSQLSASVLPKNASDSRITWASSKPSVASVSADGLITALGEGNATISATAGGVTGKCELFVQKAYISVQRIDLSPKELVLTVGETASLTATISPQNASEPYIDKWTSSDPDIVSVDNGEITAKKTGTASIKAFCGGIFGESIVKAVSKKVETILLDKTSLDLLKGESFTLTATITPSDAEYAGITWESSDKNVATVDNGKVMAIGGGSATITAEAGGKTASCIVSVSVPVERITLSEETISIEKGSSHKLSVNFYPEDATDRSVIWSSSDESIARIQQDGTITAIEGGNAVIIAVSNNKTATCKVTVTIPVSGISLSKTSLSLNKGESYTLSATISPGNASDKSVKWSSSNNSVASIDDGRVIAVGAGTATITASAGNVSADCTVTVSVPLVSIRLNQTSLSMYVGQLVTLTAEASPSDATNVTFVWSSSDPTIVNVDNGKLTAVREGTANITVQSGSISATCKVSVDRIGNGGHEGVGYEDWN